VLKSRRVVPGRLLRAGLSLNLLSGRGLLAIWLSVGGNCEGCDPKLINVS
jgi:hypothetical protein